MCGYNVQSTSRSNSHHIRTDADQLSGVDKDQQPGAEQSTSQSNIPQIRTGSDQQSGVEQSATVSKKLELKVN